MRVLDELIGFMPLISSELTLEQIETLEPVVDPIDNEVQLYIVNSTFKALSTEPPLDTLLPQWISLHGPF